LSASLSRVLLKSLWFLFGLLPDFVRQQIGFLAGIIFGLFPSKEKVILQLQIEKIFKPFASRLNQTNRIPNASLVFAHLGQTVAECANFKRLLCEKNFTFKDGEVLKKLMQEKGTLIVSAHVSNWELLAAYLNKYGYTFSAVGQEAKSPILQEIFSNFRQENNVNTMWRNSTTSTRDLIVAVRGGQSIGLLVDQDTSIESLFSSFFGKQAKTPSKLLEFGLKYQLNIIALYIVRSRNWYGKSSYDLVFKELKENSVIGIIDSYHLFLEKVIISNPEQWVWFHKRWRTLETGQKLSTKEYISFLKQL
jgi:Kdo2-lipid IVA lauroyltransferase/acyltransferase